MYDYLLSAGFQEIEINKRKYGKYLFFKSGCDDNYVIYAMKNGVKYFMKKIYGMDVKSFPDQMMILKYGDIMTVKLIDNVKTSRILKQVAYKKMEYDMIFQNFQNTKVDYAIAISSEMKVCNDVIDVLQKHHIQVMVEDDKYQENIDQWLDKN
jgi:hypothetical protein